MKILVYVLAFAALSTGHDHDDAIDSDDSLVQISTAGTNLPMSSAVRMNMLQMMKRMGAADETKANFLIDPSMQMNAAQGFDSPRGFIIGGQDSTPGAFPYIASLRLGGLGHFCGGVLISSTIVLTAAHCLVRNDGSIRSASSLNVVLGENNLNLFEGTEQVFAVSQVAVNPFFIPANRVNDIAVLRLASPVTFNRFIQSIPIAFPDEEFLGQTCNISGWGSQIIGQGDPSIILQFTQTNVISNAQCANTFTVDEGKICSLSEAFDTGGCFGDSGGPLECGGILTGLVSGGSFDCSTTSPTIYTRISFYANFIQQFL